MIILMEEFIDCVDAIMQLKVINVHHSSIYLCFPSMRMGKCVYEYDSIEDEKKMIAHKSHYSPFHSGRN